MYNVKILTNLFLSIFLLSSIILSVVILLDESNKLIEIHNKVSWQIFIRMLDNYALIIGRLTQLSSYI